MLVHIPRESMRMMGPAWSETYGQCPSLLFHHRHTAGSIDAAGQPEWGVSFSLSLCSWRSTPSVWSLHLSSSRKCKTTQTRTTTTIVIVVRRLSLCRRYYDVTCYPTTAVAAALYDLWDGEKSRLNALHPPTFYETFTRIPVLLWKKKKP